MQIRESQQTKLLQLGHVCYEGIGMETKAQLVLCYMISCSDTWLY